MTTKMLLRSLCGMLLLACLDQAHAAAQPLDKRVLFTFSAPVSLPGRTLPPGQYLFRIPDLTSSRNLVQVLSADGTKSYGVFFSIPARRLVVPEKPEVRFMETSASMPHAIRTWWYPGDGTGFEFIYPKQQARLLAQGSAQSVLTTQAQTTTAAETATDQLTRVSSSGQETNVDLKVAPAASTPAGEAAGGEVAPDTLVIPSKPVPVKAGEE
jgi:hypothetical protein